MSKKEEGRDEIDFLHVDQHQTFLQVVTINLGGYGQACTNYTKQKVCEIFAIFQNFEFWVKVRPMTFPFHNMKSIPSVFFTELIVCVT